jgi:2-polyprenyl-6-methoxyphenol hydroxylase-like FAD-dependent oxidoreductase
VGPVFTLLGTIALLTLPGDNGTWSVTIMASAGDAPLKQLRHADRWTDVVRACPLQAHWVDGEPITDVLAMSGVVDRYRRLVVDGEVVATGVACVADAWACTNPSAGRGLTVGFLHAVRLRDVLRRSGGEARTFAERFDAVTEADVAPWYHAQVAVDRARFAEIEALREGREPPVPADALAQRLAALFAVMVSDPDVFRAAMEYVATVTPIQDILERPEVVTRVREATEAGGLTATIAMPGPDRTRLLELIG